MAYSGMPPEFFKDMLHVWSPRAVIDFTACDLTAAMVCLEAKLPYLGVCFSEAHMVAGYRHLSQMVFDAMCDESNVLHDPKLSAIVHTMNGGDEDGTKKKPSNKRKAAPKNAATVPATAGSSDGGAGADGGGQLHPLELPEVSETATEDPYMLL
eukprot:g32234.t1